MSEQWTKVHPSHNDANCELWLMPWEVKGKGASIKVHVDNNAKVTWVGHKEVGHHHQWVSLAEALSHNFHKIVAICGMKDLSEHCLIYTPSHKFECVRCLNNKIVSFIQEKCGLCVLLKSLPDLNSSDVNRCTPGRLAVAETKLKRVCEKLEISHDN